MLIPDNIHPERTIYFNGAFVLAALQEGRRMDIFDLYMRTITVRSMSMAVFILCLDWLFLIDLVKVSEHGTVELCS